MPAVRVPKLDHWPVQCLVNRDRHPGLGVRFQEVIYLLDSLIELDRIELDVQVGWSFNNSCSLTLD